MNWDRIEDTWAQFTGSLKKRRSKLADEPLEVTVGKRDKPASAMQETSGIAKDEAGEQAERVERHHKH